MKPRIKLDEAGTPDGGTLALFEHDGSFVISLAGKELMHSKASASEEILGRVGVAGLKPDQSANVLIGGLGLGFTLRAALNSAGPKTAIGVIELLPAVIEWNRTHLAGLNGSCLEDARVRVISEDVARYLRAVPARSYDAILLDVDNGPIAMVDSNNSSLYSQNGIKNLCRLLRPEGRLAIWSAGRDTPFEGRLQKARIPFEIVPAKVHQGAKRDAIAIYVIQPSK